ncbi:hypothetical protein COO60DRAFT_1498930 [Scenedesmus sp. NREL 46B-D3]|nr:hypothetical protein COO60DRAFT_1498930 [Scenedesmus sp. NREL 46B-D3]
MCLAVVFSCAATWVVFATLQVHTACQLAHFTVRICVVHACSAVSFTHLCCSRLVWIPHAVQGDRGCSTCEGG